MPWLTQIPLATEAIRRLPPGLGLGLGQERLIVLIAVLVAVIVIVLLSRRR